MQVYIDLENLLKEKNISKNKVCEACKLQRTQLNNYCKNKVSRIDLPYCFTSFLSIFDKLIVISYSGSLGSTSNPTDSKG